MILPWFSKVLDQVQVGVDLYALLISFYLYFQLQNRPTKAEMEKLVSESMSSLKTSITMMIEEKLDQQKELMKLNHKMMSDNISDLKGSIKTIIDKLIENA